MSKQAERFAQQTAQDLDYGQVRKTVCPTCLGGRSGETSFGVGREPDRIWWKCLRASCDERGIVGGHTIAPAERSRRLDRVKPYTGSINPPTKQDIQYFVDRFELDPLTVEHEIRITGFDEYVLPYRDSMGHIRGYVIRQPAWSGDPAPVRHGWMGRPKAVTYPHTMEPICGWYLTEHRWGGDRLILVEDQISAMKVAEAGYNAVAILGSGVNMELIRDIARWHPKRVTIALDPDAQGTAQQMRRKWGGYFPRCDIVALEADPKDTPISVLQEDLG